jgi:hypothetical protein
MGGAGLKPPPPPDGAGAGLLLPPPPPPLGAGLLLPPLLSGWQLWYQSSLRTQR